MVVAALVTPRAAFAQVNIEALRGGYRDAPAKAQIEASFVGRTGNVQSVEAGAGAIGVVRLGRSSFFGSSRIDYARFEHQVTVSKSFVHFRYEYRFLDWLGVEGFVQQQHDKFQLLLLRELAGAGPRVTFVDEDDLMIASGASTMFEYERIAVPDGAPDRSRTFAYRLSNYVTGTWRADSRVVFSATLYVQPRWDDFSDHRVLFESALTTEIGKRFAVKFIATMRYDSEPPTTVRPTDTEVRNSIVLRF